MSDTQEKPQALIIGVGPGLGQSLARRFGREGYEVTITGRDDKKLTTIANELKQKDVEVKTAITDASDPKSFEASLRDLATKITPTIVIYNAAIIAADNVLTSDIEYLIINYNIDAFGAIVAAQVFTPAMREANRGTFIATGGYAAVDPQPAYATISLGKAGVRTAVLLMHEELKADNVHAGTVTVAGAIKPDTPMSPDLIADRFWELHQQPVSVWEAETVFDGK